MSRVIQFSKFPLFIIWLLVATGCATPLPPTFSMGDKQPVLPGPVGSIATDGNRVAAANPEGVFLKADGGTWEKLEIPGLKNPGTVSSMAFHEENLYVGTDGEGLYILSGGTWEVVNEKYSGLPGDRVLSIAVDGPEYGLPGTTLWVGTREGIAALNDGTWTMYDPENLWIDAISPSGMDLDDSVVYVGPRYKLVHDSRMKVLFKPPVGVIAVGPGQVLFSNRSSQVAVLGAGSVAVINFVDDLKVESVVFGEDAIWVGTDWGLLWGGVTGKSAGRPWPSTLPQVRWKGSLSGTRDTRPFEYRWFQVGYNTAKVSDLVFENNSLWVAFTKGDSSVKSSGSIANSFSDEPVTDPIIDLRRYLNINEYIARHEKPSFESYGKDDGLKGDTLAVAPVFGSGEVWVGTEKGLYRLGR